MADKCVTDCNFVSSRFLSKNRIGYYYRLLLRERAHCTRPTTTRTDDCYSEPGEYLPASWWIRKRTEHRCSRTGRFKMLGRQTNRTLSTTRFRFHRVDYYYYYYYLYTVSSHPSLIFLPPSPAFLLSAPSVRLTLSLTHTLSLTLTHALTDQTDRPFHSKPYLL